VAGRLDTRPLGGLLVERDRHVAHEVSVPRTSW
jgi:hypothetical protein